MIVPLMFSNRRRRGGLQLLVYDSFTAANGTQINSRACDTGQTPVVWSGYSAANATIQSNVAQFNNSGVIYTATKPIKRVVVDYVDLTTGYNDIRFCFTNGDATDGFAVRYNANMQLLYYPVGLFAWDSGGNPSGFTTGTIQIDITAAGIAVKVTDNSLGVIQRTYTGAIGNTSSAKVSLGSNSGIPSFDNLKAYG